MAIESALIPVCLPLIQFSLKQPERFVQRNRTKIIKNVSALRLGLQHTRCRSAFDDPPIIEQMLNSAVIGRPGHYEYKLLTELEAEVWLTQGRFVTRVAMNFQM